MSCKRRAPLLSSPLLSSPRRSFAIATITLMAIGCDVQLVAQPPVPTASIASETASVFSPASQSEPARVIVAFNSFATGHAIAGWAHSTTPAAGSWTECHAAQLGCGSAGGPVPLATGMAGLYDQQGWIGDPGLAAGVDPDVVVMTNLADTELHKDHTNDGVVASVSLDGGRTFVNTQFVNETGRHYLVTTTGPPRFHVGCSTRARPFSRRGPSEQ